MEGLGRTCKQSLLVEPCIEERVKQPVKEAVVTLRGGCGVHISAALSLPSSRWLPRATELIRSLLLSARPLCRTRLPIGYDKALRSAGTQNTDYNDQ